jgi:hypothetical protein
MSTESVNYWKFATLGILLVGTTIAATLLVIGRDSKTEPASPTAQVDEVPVSTFENKATASGSPAEETSPQEHRRGARIAQAHRNTSGAVPPPPPYAPQAAHRPQPAQSPYPPQSVMDACNRYAGEQVNSKTEEVLKNAALGAAIGAAVGAAGGAIASGGKGAGKGAAIGGITGVAGGTLYGLNETKSQDAQYQAAYSSCMRSKGY